MTGRFAHDVERGGNVLAPLTAAVPAGAADVVAALVDGIAERGHAIGRGVLPDATLAALRARVAALDAAHALRPATVGHGAARARHADVRGDRIRWLDEASRDPAEAAALALLDALRVACNRSLMTGLVEYEGHFALYPPGASYARHRDCFRDDDTRVVSSVLYLNDGWRVEDGGALRLYVEGGRAVDIRPEAGTLVAFLSARFDHEVLPARRPRLALTGWFRRRPLASGHVRPAC
jgi:SM-20-related protein